MTILQFDLDIDNPVHRKAFLAFLTAYDSPAVEVPATVAEDTTVVSEKPTEQHAVAESAATPEPAKPDELPPSVLLAPMPEPERQGSEFEDISNVPEQNNAEDQVADQTTEAGRDESEPPYIREVTREEFDRTVRDIYSDDKSIAPWLKGRLTEIGVKLSDQLSDEQRNELFAEMEAKYDRIPF
ncbi:MAG: hypothetical protein CMK32_07750 [Porticoccaceae bacterium]|nr:hypothetical protein [Porticoccaceae bacterium]